MSYLQQFGINSQELIEKYSLRTEADTDILKIYYKKGKGELFQHSVKLKFPRQIKSVRVDSNSHRFETTAEIAPSLLKVLEELDTITQGSEEIVDVKARVLGNLRHLEKVVAQKIREIEQDLDKLL